MTIRRYIYLLLLTAVLLFSGPALASADVSRSPAAPVSALAEPALIEDHTPAVAYYTLAIPLGFGLLSIVGMILVLRPKSK